MVNHFVKYHLPLHNHLHHNFDINRITLEPFGVLRRFPSKLFKSQQS